MNLEYKGDMLNVELIDEGRGDVIVLLHGWGATAKLYRSIIDFLSPHFRVIAPDLPGFGGTTEPSFPYSAADYADFVLTLLRELDIKRCSFIGHSHGGRTVLEIVSRKALNLTADKAVLFDSAGLPAKQNAKKTFRVRLYKALKTLVTSKPMKKAFPDALDRLQKKFGSADYAAASPLMRASMVKVLSEDYSSRLRDIKTPTLLVWGENDTATPLSDGKFMSENIPDAGLVTVKGGGHFSFLDDPVLTRRVLSSFFKF